MGDQPNGILVVDDSKMMRHVVVSMLHDFGYPTVFEADSMEKARNVLERVSVMLVLSDWHMPGGSGLDLLHFVRETPALAAIPFVMVTTENQRESVFEAAKVGVQAFMCKPLQKEPLFEKLTLLSSKYGFPAPRKLDPPAPEKCADQLKVEPVRALAGDADIKLGFRISEHDAVVSLSRDHPLAAELKKIYPQARFVRVTDEDVEKTFNVSIRAWEEEVKRLDQKQKEPA